MSDDTTLRERGEPEASWPGFALPRGTVVNGYRLERVLGSGGFGITYLAVDLLQQRFAIKEYYPQQFATRHGMTVGPTTTEDTPLFDECRERFLREAQALVLLGRTADAAEGIVRVRTYFEAFGTCFLVMDYVEGDSFANVLRREPGGLAAARVHSLLTQLLASVRLVHAAGLLHRDIKPANIIVRAGDRLVLIDFGATRQATPGDMVNFTQIYSGGYGPPEQMLGQPQGEFSDIYAIGAVCYRAIGGTVVNALARQNSLGIGRPDPQPPAATIGADRYPSALLKAIDAALAVDPAQRPQSVDAMLDILGSGEPAGKQVAMVSQAAPTALSSRRYGPWLLVAAAGALAVAGAAYLIVRSPVTDPVAPPPHVDARAPIQPAVTPRPDAGDHSAQMPTVTTSAPLPEPTGTRPEAIVVPPPAPAPALPPAPAVVTPFERAQDAARSLPCSALNLGVAPDGIRIVGFAAAGAELDRFLADLRGAGGLSDGVTRIERIACPAVEALAPVVRNAATSRELAIRLNSQSVASGEPLSISVSTTLPVRYFYVDLYQADGVVRHLLRPSRSALAERRAAEWTATPPPGRRVIVAFATAVLIDPGARPETEREADYLNVLRTLLAGVSGPVGVDLAMLTVRAAEPVAAKPPQPRPANVRPEKCANIISRAQLGETLSNADLAALRNECRS